MKYSVFDIKSKDGKITESLKVSRLCFGSLCIGPLQSSLSLDEGAAIICRAFEKGVNFTDTAQLYKTYPYIRRALEKFPGREDIIISTKTYAYTRHQAKEAVDEALFELGREYIDIFMLHEQESIYTLNGHREALDYLFEMKACGKIKAVGISTHHISGVLGAIEWNENKANENCRLDIIHPIYNINALGVCGGVSPETRLCEMEAAILKAKKNGMFVLAMKALGGGNLFSSAEKAFDFVLSKPFIDSVAVGMKSTVEVDANILYFDKRKFTDEYYNTDMKTKRIHIEDWCVKCGKCVDFCPANALYIKDKAVCDNEKCVLCGYCSSVCENFAIKVI